MFAKFYKKVIWPNLHLDTTFPHSEMFFFVNLSSCRRKGAACS